jgi:cytoskeletal protein RodZ
MVQKETIRKMADMPALTTRGPADRDRAVDRVRRLTVGATVAGIVAVGGFAGLAAATWRGADSTITTAAVTTTTADAAAGSTSGTSTTSGVTTTSSTTTTTTTRASTATLAPTATTPAVTSATGTAHATTGGS